MSDVGSVVIDTFGIRNPHIPEDHDWYGVPLPGMYLLDEEGRVFDKHFVADHAVRESVNSALQERFAVDIGQDGLVTARAQGVTTRAWFTTPTIRRAQMTVLTVELELAPGLHVYGRPLPEGYIPVELAVDGGEGLAVQQVVYPEPQPQTFAVIGETLPVYEGLVSIKVHCLAQAREGHIDVKVALTYQVCDATECYLPERLTFDMKMSVVDHVSERV